MAGWTVGTATRDGGGLFTTSRYVSLRHRVGSPSDDVVEFVAGVATAAQTARYDAVFTVGDAETLALSRHRADIDACFPFPPDEIVVRALDKLELTSAARAAGVPTPLTQEAAAADLERFSYPVAIKARLHWRPGAPTAHHATIIADNPSIARRRIHELAANGVEAVVQEAVDGQLIAYCCVADRSEVYVHCQQKAVGVWPHPAGVSTCAVTVPVDAQLAEGVARLLEHIGWSGLAEVQFVQPDAGPARLIDFNGRFYGSMVLAIAAGANLPVAWADLAMRHPVRRQSGRPGTCYQWLEGDAKRAWAVGDRGRAAQVARVLGKAPFAVHTTWAPSDPRPAAHYVASVLRRGARRLR